MEASEAIENRVLARINAEVGNDFKKLHRASVVLEHYNESMQIITRKLNYDQDEGNNHTSIKTAFHFNKQTMDSIEFELEKLEQFRKKLLAKIKESQAVLDIAQSDLEEVRKLQQLLQYLRIVQDIQEISHCLYTALKGKDDSKMVNIYLTLHENNDCENSVIGRLQGIEAPFLKQFALRTASYWYKKLKEHLSTEFENVLKQMRWGLKEQDFLSHPPSQDHVAKAQVLAEYLFLVRPPSEEEEQKLTTITSNIICQPISTVTTLLLAPYRQRFMYHFTGTRQTNRLDKPEWYFTQILNWGKEAHVFVGSSFQPSAIKAGRLNFNIRLEFLRGLVQLTIEKIAADIKEVSLDESLFAHLLDETIAFEMELRDLFGYPASFPNAISVFTQPTYLLQWISFEERFCTSKMDAVLQAENPWMLIDPNMLIDDELKIPMSADQFMCLLEAIKERYCSLIQPGHQLQFLALQLELIDNFRRRLVQLHSRGLVPTVPILNAVNYITMVLREWGEQVHYLHLQAALIGANATEINSVFEEPINEMEHWTKELIDDLAMKAVNEIKAKSMPYRHDNWSNMPEQNTKEPLILSSSAGEMLQIAVTILHNLERDLSKNLFNVTLRKIAKEIDEYLLNSLVMTTKFSPGGAAQFKYDMTRNLFPIFGQYAQRPDLLFKRVNDAILIFNFARGTALLLYETLRSDSPQDAKIAALKELGITNFSPKISIEVLERRGDLRLL